MKRKAILSFLLALVMAVTSVMPAMAEEVPVAESEDGYLENHYQIDLTNLDIDIDDGELEVEVQDDLSRREEIEAEEDAETLEFLVDRYDDDLVDFIEESVEDAEENDRILGAICMTECPLEPNEDGDYDRIEAADAKADDSPLIREAAAANNATGAADHGGTINFSLVTSVSRESRKNSAGEYLYYATSKGVWSNKEFGTGKRPATGYDYIMQSTPGVISSEGLNITYCNGKKVRATSDYYHCDGGTKWTEYALKDSGSYYGGELVSCALITGFRAKSSTQTRKVNSYYVHTWSSMSVAVSVNASSSSGVSLSIAPSKSSKSWTAHGYVTFRF
ncbi:MAG: hypothetical protein Q3985_03625 [Eubacteriales bacterium]|nr:hypothetical protein [Eubacteriales bacterium]